MAKTDMTAGGGYGMFQGHMSAHDMALNQGTQQQQGYSLLCSFSLTYLLIFSYSWILLFVIYPCTFLTAVVYAIFHVGLSIFLWNVLIGNNFRAKLASQPLFGTLAFQNRLHYRNSNLKTNKRQYSSASSVYKLAHSCSERVKRISCLRKKTLFTCFTFLFEQRNETSIIWLIFCSFV